VAQNNIQFTSNTSGHPMVVSDGDNNTITQNVISGGALGLQIFNTGVSNVISQNIVRNCGHTGASIGSSVGSSNIAFVSNQFGECGVAGPGAVIALSPTQGPNDITLLNNVYQGHANSLTFFIDSLAHLNFVSGNTQTQTALPNNLP